MAQRSPTSPTSAYYRLMRMMLAVNHGGKGLQPTPHELDVVSRVFVRAGGSWAQVFLGGVDDNKLLKTVIKVAVAKDLISKAPKWG